MRRKQAIAVAGVCLLLASVPVVAHHAFSAEFDADKPIKMRGTVSKVEWINPHTWIHVDVKGSSGAAETWMVEGGTPNTLFRRGVNKDSLKIGTEIVIDGYQAKDGSRRANGRDLTLPNGQKLFLGSAGGGEGAPPAATTPPAR